MKSMTNRIAAVFAFVPIVGYAVSALSYFFVWLRGFDLHTAIVHRISDLAFTIPTRLVIPFITVDIIALLMLKKTRNEKGHRVIRIAAVAGLVISIAVIISIGYLLLTGPSIHDLPNQ